MVLYVDSIFIINFFMNYIILALTGKIINPKYGRHVSNIRYVLGSLITTSIYIAVLLIDALRNNFNFFIAMFMIAMGIIFCYRPSSKKMFLSYFLAIHIVAFAIGGMCFGIFYYTKAGALIGNTVTTTLNNVSFKLLISSTCVSYLVVKGIAGYIEKVKISKQEVLTVSIGDEKEKSFQMLVDTGNGLIEPITQLPVIVMCYKDLKGIIDNELFEIYEHKKDVVSEAYALDSEITKHLKIIPFKSVGKENGIILGVECFVRYTYLGVAYNKRCVIGIVDFEILGNGDYSGIFNPRLLGEECEDVKKIMVEA